MMMMDGEMQPHLRKSRNIINAGSIIRNDTEETEAVIVTIVGKSCRLQTGEKEVVEVMNAIIHTDQWRN